MHIFTSILGQHPEIRSRCLSTQHVPAIVVTLRYLSPYWPALKDGSSPVAFVDEDQSVVITMDVLASVLGMQADTADDVLLQQGFRRIYPDRDASFNHRREWRHESGYDIFFWAVLAIGLSHETWDIVYKYVQMVSSPSHVGNNIRLMRSSCDDRDMDPQVVSVETSRPTFIRRLVLAWIASNECVIPFIWADRPNELSVVTGRLAIHLDIAERALIDEVLSLDFEVLPPTSAYCCLHTVFRSSQAMRRVMWALFQIGLRPFEYQLLLTLGSPPGSGDFRALPDAT
jgi:hypothetical protein